jgi:hypothetical protein
MARYLFDMYRMRLKRRSKGLAWFFLCMWSYFLIGDVVRGYVVFSALIFIFALENLYCLTRK